MHQTACTAGCPLPMRHTPVDCSIMNTSAPPKKPTVVVIAGPNGAGKSTAAPLLLKGALGVLELVNADQIAVCLSAYAPETVSLGGPHHAAALARVGAIGQQLRVREHAVAMSRKPRAVRTC